MDESTHTHDDRFFFEEVKLAFRNRGMPAEGLRLPVTPTGMHYLLNHFDIPIVDPGTWRLKVGGHVNSPLKFDLAAIKQRPAVTLPVTMECAGNGRAFMKPRLISQPWIHEAVSTAEWTGTPLKGVLEEAGIAADAVDVVFTGQDRGIQSDEDQFYQRSLTVADALRDEVLLVYAMNGAPLEPQHSAPLRLVVPGWYGMGNVKWLHQIELVSEPFNGAQMQFYRETDGEDDTGTVLETMKVRALMAPPGISILPSLDRRVDAGTVRLVGRAWAGRHQVARVEVSVDGGQTWSDGKLEDPIGEFAWRGWFYDWDAKNGEHTLCCRGTDTAGRVQPVEQVWTHYGVGNNAVASLKVSVE